MKNGIVGYVSNENRYISKQEKIQISLVKMKVDILFSAYVLI